MDFQSPLFTPLSVHVSMVIQSLKEKRRNNTLCLRLQDHPKSNWCRREDSWRKTDGRDNWWSSESGFWYTFSTSKVLEEVIEREHQGEFADLHGPKGLKESLRVTGWWGHKTFRPINKSMKVKWEVEGKTYGGRSLRSIYTFQNKDLSK